MTKLFDAAYAAELDRTDELAKFRDCFNIPPSVSNPAQPSVYLCGNSLGCQPKRSVQYIKEELDKWASQGVEGHFADTRPWASIDETVLSYCAELVGAARVHEVAVMNSLTVNLHLLMVSFYRPTPTKYKIICEAQPFPSDSHAFISQIRLHGFDPETALVRIPQAGDFLTEEEIFKCIEEHADSTALILLPGVQYYTGQVFPLEKIAKLAQRLGILFGVDLAHAVGNVSLKLHDWGIDFASWCSYKYLNSGPGGISGVFLHDKHSDHTDPRFPRLDGWFGQPLQDRFKMGQHHVPLKGAGAFVMSNPSVLTTVSLLGSLEIFHEARMERLTAKSRRLTGYLEDLLIETKLYPELVKVLTPRECRGCQLSLQVKGINARDVHQAISAQGVICDVREPNVLRIAPVPLYNSFSDVFHFVRILSEELQQQQQQQRKQQSNL